MTRMANGVKDIIWTVSRHRQLLVCTKSVVNATVKGVADERRDGVVGKYK